MKIQRIKEDKFVTYEFETLSELVDILDDWKDEFRKINKTDEIIKSGGKDKSYERYCLECDQIYEKYKDKMYPV